MAAFDANAVGYLLKPISQARLAHALERAEKLLQSDKQAEPAPAAGREAAGGVSRVGAERAQWGCLARSVLYYVEHRRDDRAVRQRIREIAERRFRYGFPRIQILLRREGSRENHKRTYRIHKEEGLICAARDHDVARRQRSGSSGRC